MQKALIMSLLLHLLFVILSVINMNFSFRDKVHKSNTMIFDFVKIAEKSAAPKLSPSKPKISNKQEQTKETTHDKKPQKLEKKTDSEEQPQPTITAKEKNQKVEKKPEPKPKADVNPPKKKQEKFEKNLVDLSKKEKKSKTLDKKAPQKETKLDDILGDIDPNEHENINESNEKSASAEGVSDVVTASEIDAVKQTIYKCWVVPLSAKEIDDLVVDIDMTLSPEGMVIEAKISDKSKMHDNAYRITAESALRALMDPKCNPLPFPSHKYEEWKNVTFSFSPKDVG